MFTKKTLVATAICTFIATAAVAVTGTYFYFRFSRYDVVAQARNLIREHYVDQLSDEQMDKMNDYAISAMVASLEDPVRFL